VFNVFSEKTTIISVNATDFSCYGSVMLIAVTARFNAWVCDRLLAGISGSNSGGGMDVCRL
jgi:hypothetical protein